MRFFVMAFLLLSACSTTPKIDWKNRPPLIPQSQWPEHVDSNDPHDPDRIPPDAREIPLPDHIDPEEFAMAIMRGDEAPRQGILVSEARAIQNANLRIYYPGTRDRLIMDRRLWGIQRSVYEDGIVQRDRLIEEAKPGWWTRNKFFIGTFLGIAGGAALTYGLLGLSIEIRETLAD